MVKLKQRQDGDVSTAARSRFSSYRKEDQKRQRERHIQPDRQLDKAIRAWERFRRISDSEMVGEPWQHEELVVEMALGFTESIEASQSTINKFILSLLSDDTDPIAIDLLGTFMSALISTSQRDRLSFSLPVSGNRLDKLSIWSQKDVRVRGDLGLDTGRRMSAGRMTIEGDVLEGLGYGMSGGEIVLNGNVLIQPSIMGSFEGTGIGEEMTGGEIRINGDVVFSPKWFECGFMGRDLIQVAGGLVTLNGRIVEKQL